MEIINWQSGLLKMAAMGKFNVCSSESKNGKITVNFACVYHYHSYFGLHFSLSQTWAPRIFKLYSSLSNQWTMFLFAISSCFMPCLLPYTPFSSWPFEMPFYFISFFDSVTPLHELTVAFVATEQGILCRSVSPEQRLGYIVGEYSVCSVVL